MKESTKTLLWIVAPLTAILTYIISFYLFAFFLHKSGATDALDTSRPYYSIGAANFIMVIMYCIPFALSFWILFNYLPIISRKIGKYFLLGIGAFTLLMAVISVIGCGDGEGLVSSYCWGSFITLNVEIVGAAIGVSLAYVMLKPQHKEIDKYKIRVDNGAIDSTLD